MPLLAQALFGLIIYKQILYRILALLHRHVTLVVNQILVDRAYPWLVHALFLAPHAVLDAEAT